ncbi:TPA: phage tail tape measure protein [Pseudomonas aeruginosa]|uniref:phage tail tape measure protein n=1 Tax=Pseudomonas aeruginosa TaxID=287 RepID=UPI0003B9D8D7|nr:phage tail tape measure protein [Pseudomonas aeruginosa]ERV72666.1 phage tail tape measure protein, TP901 family, core region [Pseudomonas aeruginosa BL04]KSE82244.1 phage tail tape measure protein [Pseudomonas aeruginosa]MBG3914747.1 phage tail tape measure protein [Pseudomonas aeruginosa]MBG5150318.1 phage tail tape measure protein [Pseudomonas aeruginosa]MBG6809942.1 phage tail tape measure protein [Pseudomonas aeruginosa]
MSTNSTARLDFVLRLIDQVTAPAAQASKALMDVAEVGKNGFMQVGAGIAGVVGSVVAFRQSLAPALEQTGALGEIQSLGVAQDALDGLNQASMEFAANYGEHATAFVRSAYQVEGAIKGLVGNELAAITNASNVLAKATRADADTMTTYIGTMYGLFQGQADAMGRAKWVEQLTGQTARAVQLFRTSGEQMNEAFKATGIGASAAGASLVEQMAVLGQLSQTMEGGEAGGLYKAFFENVSAAQDKLGMKFTDAGGRLLPIMQILDKLQTKFGNLTKQTDLDAITGAFGGEAARMIVTLLKDTGALANNLDQLGKVKGMERAERMARAMVDPWQRLDSVIENIRISFGMVLLPVLNPLIERVAEAGKTFQRWLGMFPNIARWLGYITLGVLALTAAAGALTLLGGLVTLFSVLVSPVALLVAGFAALVVAVGATIIWWDELQAAFGNTTWFQALVTMATPVVLTFRILVAVLSGLWDVFSALWTIGGEYAQSLGLLSEGAGTATGAWGTFLQVLANVSPFALIGKALKGLIALLNLIPGINIDAEFGTLPQAAAEGATVPIVPAASQAQPRLGADVLERVMPKAPELPLVLQASVTPPGVPAQPLQLLPQAAPLPVLQQPLAPTLGPVPALPTLQQPLAPVLGRVTPPSIPAQPLQLLPEAAPLPDLQQRLAPTLGPVSALPTLQQPLDPLLGQLKPPAAQPLHLVPQVPPLPPQPMEATNALEGAEKARESINRAIPRLAPKQATSVPPGGFLRAIQNTSTVNRGMHVEKVEIHTSKAPTAHDLEGLLEMAG